MIFQKFQVTGFGRFCVLFNELTANVLPTPFVTPRLLGPLENVTEPLGLTVKLIVPLPSFENENGLGLVVT